MKKFLKSPFNILSIFFTAIGLLILYSIIDIPSSCSYEYEEYNCWRLPFWVPLILFIFAIIFFLGGRKEAKQNNTKN